MPIVVWDWGFGVLREKGEGGGGVVVWIDGLCWKNILCNRVLSTNNFMARFGSILHEKSQKYEIWMWLELDKWKNRFHHEWDDDIRRTRDKKRTKWFCTILDKCLCCVPYPKTQTQSDEVTNFVSRIELNQFGKYYSSCWSDKIYNKCIWWKVFASDFFFDCFTSLWMFEEIKKTSPHSGFASNIIGWFGFGYIG